MTGERGELSAFYLPGFAWTHLSMQIFTCWWVICGPWMSHCKCVGWHVEYFDAAHGYVIELEDWHVTDFDAIRCYIIEPEDYHNIDVDAHITLGSH